MNSYERLNFANGQPPQLNDVNLNHIDKGIADAFENTEENKASIRDLTTKNEQNTTDIVTIKANEKTFEKSIDLGTVTSLQTLINYKSTGTIYTGTIAFSAEFTGSFVMWIVQMKRFLLCSDGTLWGFNNPTTTTATKVTYSVDDVNKALAKKQDTLMLDSTPTIGSDNFLNSDSIAKSLLEKADRTDVEELSQALTKTSEQSEKNTISIENTYSKNDIDNLCAVTTIPSHNLMTSALELGTLNSTTGLPNVNSSRMRTADFIEVEPMTTYTLTEYSEIKNAVAVFGYDNSGAFVGTVTNKSANYAFQTFTTAANVAKLKFWVASTDLTIKYQIELGSTSTAYVEPTGEKKMNISENEISAKTLERLNYKMNYLYVSNDFTSADDGFGITKFNTIKSANDSIVDNSESNRYTIKVADGTYNDLQTLYAGTDDSVLPATEMIGINIKNYVAYEGNVKNPSACVIKWDGATGFDTSTLVYANVSHKCPFHAYGFKNDMHYTVKGFTFDCKNIRYCFHTDSAAAGYKCEWSVEDCIFIWGGTPDCTDNNNSKACWGCGHSPFELGQFVRCKIIPSSSLMGYQNHDSGGGAGANSAVVVGAKITVEDCDFGGSVIQARSLNGKICDINNSLKLINCANIKRIDNLFSGASTEAYWTIKESE